MASVQRVYGELPLQVLLQSVEEWEVGEELPVVRRGDAYPDDATLMRGYRRAMLKVHPDKVFGKEVGVQLRCAELLKIINGKYEEWKRRRGWK